LCLDSGLGNPALTRLGQQLMSLIIIRISFIITQLIIIIKV